jgi:hypothetical protein
MLSSLPGREALSALKSILLRLLTNSQLTPSLKDNPLLGVSLEWTASFLMSQWMRIARSPSREINKAAIRSTWLEKGELLKQRAKTRSWSQCLTQGQVSLKKIKRNYSRCLDVLRALSKWTPKELVSDSSSADKLLTSSREISLSSLRLTKAQDLLTLSF